MENIYFRSFFSRMGIIIYIYIWIVNIFYINPYKVATTVELYEVLKKQIISQKSEYYEELNSLELK